MVVERITILRPGLPQVREIILPFAQNKDANEIETVKLKENTTNGHSKESELYLPLNDYHKFLHTLLQLKTKEDEEPVLVREKIDHFPNPRNYDEKVHNALKNVRDILSRAYERRTGMFSWALYLMLNYFGFEGDKVENIKQTLQDPKFAEDFTKYYSIVKNNGTEEGEKFLNETFKDEKAQKLAKLVFTNISICDRVPAKFIQRFPIIFSIFNLGTPVLLGFMSLFGLKTGTIYKFFDCLRIINPWISEFIAEPTAIFKAEINEVKKNIPRVQKENEQKIEKEIVDSVELKDLSEEQYKLQKIASRVDSAFERLFGRETTLSSWIVKGLLWWFFNKKDYRAFAKPIVTDTEFTQKLHSHLQKVKENTSFREEMNLLDNSFKEKKEQKLIGGIISLVASIAKSLPDWFINKAPRYFGLPYSFQYLFMPILTKIWGTDTFFGKLLAILRDVNPWINDLLLDPIATFQEEIREVREESQKLPELIPERKMPNTLNGIIQRFKSFGNTIRSLVTSNAQTA